MPANKQALRRYMIIDRCLANKLRRYPDIDHIRGKIESELGTGISVSMIHKDFADMKSLYDAPIRYDRANAGYCYTEPDFSIREFPLLEEEVTALDQSIAVLRQIKGSGLFAHFENAINKIIQGYRIHEILGTNDRSFIQVEEPLAPESNRWLEPILLAIVERRALQVAYQAFARELKRHRFSPYLLRQYRHRWYAVGHSDLTGKTIVLALDRMKSVADCDSCRYVADPGFDADSYFRHSFGITHVGDARVEKVRLRFDRAQAPYILSQPLHHSQTVLKDGARGLEVSLDVHITRELIMAILGFGTGVKVLAPRRLVAQVRETVKGMAGMYGG